MSCTVVLDEQGRVVIPAEVCDKLGLMAGDRLHVHTSGHRIVLERPADAVDALRSLGRHIPTSRSLVDELLAERRLAASAGE